MLLLSNILSTALGGATALSRQMILENDRRFAMRSMIDEIQKADEIYRINPSLIQMYEREAGRAGHKVVSYSLDDGKLCRYGDHYHLKYEADRLGERAGVKNVILERVEGLSFRVEKGVLFVKLSCKDGSEERVVALRGIYE